MELIVANLSPFDARGEVDTGLLEAHARWLLASGADALAPAGTTGEFLYLSTAERRAVHAAVLRAGGRVIPCVWDASPTRAAELARAAGDEGAAAVFLPPPIYQRVTDDDILRWYAGVVEAARIPVWAYHHPGTNNPLLPPLIGRLFRDVGVAAMKDSSGDPQRLRDLARAWPGRIWAGGDQLLGPLAAGALGPLAGQVSGMANLYPALAAAVLDGADDRDWLARRAALRAGGSSVPTMKATLGFGLRPPVGTGRRPPGLPAPTFDPTYSQTPKS